MVQERYQDIILPRIDTFYSSTCTSTLLIFEFVISFLNVCIFTHYIIIIIIFIIIIIIIIIVIDWLICIAQISIQGKKF